MGNTDPNIISHQVSMPNGVVYDGLATDTNIPHDWSAPWDAVILLKIFSGGDTHDNDIEFFFGDPAVDSGPYVNLHFTTASYALAQIDLVELADSTGSSSAATNVPFPLNVVNTLHLSFDGTTLSFYVNGSLAITTTGTWAPGLPKFYFGVDNTLVGTGPNPNNVLSGVTITH